MVQVTTFTNYVVLSNENNNMKMIALTPDEVRDLHRELSYSPFVRNRVYNSSREYFELQYSELEDQIKRLLKHLSYFEHNSPFQDLGLDEIKTLLSLRDKEEFVSECLERSE